MAIPASRPDPAAYALRANLALLAVALLVAALLTEGVIRMVIRRDDEGQEWVRGLRLRPYHLPLRRIGGLLAAIEEGTSFLAYDSALGWAPRPSMRSADGRRRIDAAGVRTDRETALVPAPGVLRVAVFGDSFTFGDEVGQEDTWGVALERGLAARGVPAEVLNFGVNAYGIDQAYLRWQRVGRAHRPRVVVLGFQAENALRNLNVFRPVFFSDTEIPLSKPRFIVQDGVLTSVNAPTVPLDRLPHVLAALDDEPLIVHERYFAPHAKRWWLRSKAAAYITTWLADEGQPRLRLTDEARDVTERIIAAFAADVRATGAEFLILHLPRREDLEDRLAGRPFWYDDLLDVLDTYHEVVHPETTITTTVDAAMFQPYGHYAPVFHRVVGKALVEPVLRAAAR